MKQETGFTLIELIVVIVVIAVVSLYAVTRYVNLTSQSQKKSTDSIAAALTMVSSTNYAKRTANSSQGTAITNCTQIGPLLSGGLPSGYSISSATISAGASVSCTLTGPGSTTSTFIGMGIA